MTAATGDVVQALTPMVQALERLGVEYVVGGSVATSAYGIPRATLDVDIVCDLPQGAIDPLAAALADEYYVDAEMIHEAVAHCDSFNVRASVTARVCLVSGWSQMATARQAYRWASV